MNNKFVWHNPYLPQTLMSGEFILYFRAIFGLVFCLGGLDIITLVIVLGYGIGAFGVANLRWYGIIIGVISVGFTFIQVTFVGIRAGFSIFEIIGVFFRPAYLISTMFDIAIIALLIHPMSLNYAKQNFTKRIP